eukprot:TRINITY_DN18012_c0_g1_i1.p1 TRINITY_DN18012_c0_g1~~TRINITY_DN18012_c0_g1_i1.p1  ORF type:complete len:104 (-),score=15.76 TRINITY_DN18012_c0_g1_i1:124-396(-)
MCIRDRYMGDSVTTMEKSWPELCIIFWHATEKEEFYSYDQIKLYKSHSYPDESWPHLAQKDFSSNTIQKEQPSRKFSSHPGLKSFRTSTI